MKTLQEEREAIVEEFSSKFLLVGEVVTGFQSSDAKTYLRQALLSHEEKVVARVRRTVEEMPAFTCCSDKCMGQVSDEAKKPRWGTNYLERETLLTIISLPITDETK